ncbi:MAG: hypothetical protein NPIRA05_10640 [Nitrospirales bacterium]|nr:MAG: hypothetical protein NPIRA05_10640 [Nitrospirales bacterium]
MDTGYPALISEPRAKPNSSNDQQAYVPEDIHEPPTDPNLNSSGDASAPTPAS